MLIETIRDEEEIDNKVIFAKDSHKVCLVFGS
jgi:hypothetical protein